MKSFISIFIGAISIILGLIYLTNMARFSKDVSESTIVWGSISIIFGIILFCVKAILSKKTYKIYLEIIVLSIIEIIQFIPISLWIIFFNQPIGEHGGIIVKNFLFLIMHFLEIILFIVYIFINIKDKITKGKINST